MYVDHNRPVRFPDGVDLLLDAYRIKDDGRSFILLTQPRFEPLRNPSTASLVIERLPGLLESSSFKGYTRLEDANKLMRSDTQKPKTTD